MEISNTQDDQYDLLLLGHMDTVFEVGTAAQRPFKILGGRAYGPGVTDMIGSYGLRIPAAIITGGIIVVGIRLLNFCITTKKFSQFGILHTVGNKLSGITIFLLCPWAIVSGDMPISIIIIPFLSALEETLILLKMDDYNPNISSLFRLIG